MFCTFVLFLKSYWRVCERRTTVEEASKLLAVFGIDLIERASQNKLDPVIGREREISRLIQVLSRRAKNNPIIIGEPGVGKTAIVEGLAQAIHKHRVPPILHDKRIISLDLSAVLAGTKYRGEFEKRIKLIVKEVLEAGNIIIFIDEIHGIMGAGNSEGALDASNILKPSLSRGDFQCIGATTVDEYRRHIEKDGAFERRFQKIFLDPPTPEDTVRILRGLRERFEDHHWVKITNDALESAVELSTRYIFGRNHPDRAIDVIDEAASKVCLETANKYPEEIAALFALKSEIKHWKKECDTAERSPDPQRLMHCKERIQLLTTDMNAQMIRLRKAGWTSNARVDKKAVASAVAIMTGITIADIDEDENKKIQRAKTELPKRILGQDKAVEGVIKSLSRAQAGLKDPARPMGAFLFVGPPGVGKTFLAQELARILFGRDDSLIQIDMSEYMERHNISRLIGAPPGYVGYEEGGLLTEKVRCKPYSVVLFDEISKAHEDFTNLLLQILEEGRLTDNFGRKIDFRNTILIMTSSAGSMHFIQPQIKAGFHPEASENDTHERVMKDVEQSFRTDFLSRVDVVLFRTLEKPDFRKILRQELKKVNERLKQKNISVEINEESEAYLAEKGYDVRRGARGARKVVEEKVENILAEMILDGEIVPGQSVSASLEGNALSFQTAVEENS